VAPRLPLRGVDCRDPEIGLALGPLRPDGLWAAQRARADDTSWRAPEIEEDLPETTPLEGPVDLATDEGLRAALASLGGLQPPASDEEIEAAEAALGVELPPLLRRMYRLTNGLHHADRLFFPLSTADEEGDALLDQWHAYREILGIDDGEDPAEHAGWIGVDAYPIGSVFGDADTFVLRTDRPGVFEHYPDDGCLERRFEDVEAWLRSWLEAED